MNAFRGRVGCVPRGQSVAERVKGEANRTVVLRRTWLEVGQSVGDRVLRRINQENNPLVVKSFKVFMSLLTTSRLVLFFFCQYTAQIKAYVRRTCCTLGTR